MQPITTLPNPTIQPQGPISKLFLEQGITTFQTACAHVKAMTYGPNSDNQNSLILFEENQGTCTTKHGAIARLAQELDLPIYKNLGFYRLNDSIVNDISPILSPHNLNFIPQIHCFLEFTSSDGTANRIDLTEGNCNGKNKTIEDYDFVIRVQPDLTHQQHETYYREHLAKYRELAPDLQRFTDEQVLDLLEECDRQTKYQCSIMANRIAA